MHQIWKTKSGDDHAYDDNGNMIQDLNKNADNITYNFLYKLETIHISDKGTIQIIYDADGNKLERKYTPDGSTTKTTTYINQFVYQEDKLQYINFEEGRIRVMTPVSTNNGYDGLSIDGNMDLPNGNKGAYDYLIRDYQQNVRMILIDKDIFHYLKNDKIRIIPLININEQLGSTSLDIRLGTSFEVFFPNQFGIIDFTDKETRHNIKYNSKKINLDYLDHLPINPGQFMLGHSMEYIKLGDQISADLEGRSSFARLGIEIHMTAGFVDPGFEGVLTFEIFNAGTNPVMLYPDLRMGQLRFTAGIKPSVGYSRRPTHKYSGRLEHHFSLHGEDYEVQKISLEKDKLGKT